MERITYAKQWEEILKSYTTNPRDVHTQPLAKRTALWFYVYVEDGKLYVDRVEDVTKVTVYSNQPEVELFANGVSLGK